MYKKNGKVRVCIDFRDLNKATPMVSYPMPVADMLVDAAVGHKVIIFMDGNVRYNQIFVAEEDIPKTTFSCPGALGLYEWVVMTFGLKNAGATYQRAMNYISIYIDDVVVKSKGYQEHLEDLKKTLMHARKHGLRMNLHKCAFGVSARQFLGFMVHEKVLKLDKRALKQLARQYHQFQKLSYNL